MPERIYVALDLETTGLDNSRDAILEIGAVAFQGTRILDRYTTLINPQRAIPLRIQQITGIRNEMVADAPTLAQATPELLGFVHGEVAAVIAHNADFDLGFLRAGGVHFHRPALDTFELATVLLPQVDSYGLGELCRVLEIPLIDAHRAAGDAEATAQLFMRLQERLADLPQATLELILHSDEGVDWPLLPLFATAMNMTRRVYRTSDYAASTTAVDPGAESLYTDKGDRFQSVAAIQVADFFAPSGPLAQHMGSEYEARPGQVEMAQQVAAMLNVGDYCMVEAGTGTGKSLAYLLPAALWSVANQRRVVIATNTIALQDQLLGKDLPQVQALLAAQGLAAPNVALLKGRSNYLCTRRLHAWRTSHPLSPAELSLLAKLLIWLPTTSTGDMNELMLRDRTERAIWAKLCSDGATCSPERCGGRARAEEGLSRHRDFFLLARQAAEGAHLLVINHALLLADIAAGRRVLPPYSHLVVDEAHHLDEVATEQLTWRVEWVALHGVLNRLSLGETLLPAIYSQAGYLQLPSAQGLVQALSAASERASKSLTSFTATLLGFARQQETLRKPTGYVQRLWLDQTVRARAQWSELEVTWDEQRPVWEAAQHALSELVQSLDAALWWQSEPTATLFSELQGWQSQLSERLTQLDTIILQPQSSERGALITWLEQSDKGETVTLCAAPLRVNDLLANELLIPLRAAIFTGATLRAHTDFTFMQERLGLWGVKASTVESPFDYEASTLLYLPSDLPLPNNADYQRAVEQAIVAAAEATGGRTLALFTNMAQLRSTGNAIRTALDRSGITVLEQGHGSRNRLLREYRQTEKAVLLGTRSFWEGIDLPGDELNCLLIVRLPFAVPGDPLISARTADLEDPFNEYQLPEAILRFRQGFGRLIRRATDRGVVVLLDSRLWQKSYGPAFLAALPTCTTRRAPLVNLGAAIQEWLIN